MNLSIFKGKLGKDPELRHTPAGTPVCKFSLAVSKKYTDASGQKKTQTLWVRVVAWRKLAEVCAQYLVKGQECLISGEIADATWEKDGVKHKDWELVAMNMEFCGPAPSSGSAPEDDIPF